MAPSFGQCESANKALALPGFCAAEERAEGKSVILGLCVRCKLDVDGSPKAVSVCSEEVDCIQEHWRSCFGHDHANCALSSVSWKLFTGLRSEIRLPAHRVGDFGGGFLDGVEAAEGTQVLVVQFGHFDLVCLARDDE